MPTDATFAALADEIASARDALLELASEQPDRWWRPYELKVQARNGWSAGAMDLALEELIDAGALEVGQALRVRVHG